MTRFGRLMLAQDLMLGILGSAPDGLDLREWNKRAREAGVNSSRPSTAGDFRLKLQAYGLVTQRGGQVLCHERRQDAVYTRTRRDP